MPNPPIYFETGHISGGVVGAGGQTNLNIPSLATLMDRSFRNLISLGGVPGRVNLGRVLSSDSKTLTGIGPPTPLMIDNPQRISAIIQNAGDPALPGVAIVDVYLGGLNSIPIRLVENGTLQLDANFPWTGSVWVTCAGATPVVRYNEVSVP